nr:MAG: hypothetical protein 2 [Salisharnavirus sp.]
MDVPNVHIREATPQMLQVIAVPYYVLEYICFKADVDIERLVAQCHTIHEEDFSNVYPQSEEQVVHSQQNVMFMDGAPGYGHDISAPLDSVHTGPTTNDIPLDDFFSRPIKIHNYIWLQNVPFNEDFYPWRDYFTNKRVVNRIANFKLLQATLCVKVLVNGSPFHFGRMLMSYNPMEEYDDLDRIRTFFVQADVVEASQRPHVYIDPTMNEGGCIRLPFTWWENAYDITSFDFPHDPFKALGKMTMVVLNNLKNVNGPDAGSVTVSVFAWAEDVRLSVPTHVNPFDIVPQADEYTGAGVISKPAMALANMVSKVKIPWIQKYATATQMAATAVGSIATLFGYSRPTMLTSSRYRPDTKGNFAVTNLEDDVVKLSVDAKQELTLDPTVFGINVPDEMSIAYIATKESYWTTFTWPINASAETMLFNALVDPMVPRQNVAGTATELHLPAVTFASMPFNRWRGSLKYRFQVVCSKFHKGRLKIVYDPHGTQGTQSEYNVAYTTVVDISENTDFEFQCGWGQSTTYRKMNDILNPEASYIGTTTPLLYTSQDGYGNGTIAVYVVNDLMVPNHSPDSELSINVFISAGDDFEVAMPTGERVTRLRLRDRSEITPQSDELTPADSSHDQPENPGVVHVAANILPTDDATNLYYFGESIRSFRQLIKRYNTHEIIPFRPPDMTASNGDFVTWKIQRASLPFEPGWTPRVAPGEPTRVPYDFVDGRYYAYATMTLLRYLTTAFVGWRGGVRYMLDMTGTDCDCSAVGPVIVSRYSECAPETALSLTSELPNSPNFQAGYQIDYDDVSGQEGIFVQNLKVNPTLCFEVPFYSEKRFMPARKLANFDLTAENYSPCWKARYKYRYISANSGTPYTKLATTFVAAAEDFNVGFYIGPPVFFYEAIPPNT